GRPAMTAAVSNALATDATASDDHEQEAPAGAEPAPGGAPQEPDAAPAQPVDAALDPARAEARIAAWRGRLAEERGEDPGAVLDEPRRRLALLKVFGSTRTLAALCERAPTAAAQALLTSPEDAVEDALRDLAAFEDGAGPPEAFGAVLAPLKDRVEAAVGVGVLVGACDAREAAAMRAQFAERAVAAALSWLIRAARGRGDLDADAFAETADGLDGVFLLAGGDLAARDLAPGGALDVGVFFDLDRCRGKRASLAERAFARIGAEFEIALGGAARGVFTVRSPFGAGVTARGNAEKLERVRAALKAEHESRLRDFLAGARAVGGDVRSGAAFLEEAASALSGRSVAPAAPAASTAPETGDTEEDDAPCTALNAAAAILRARLGARGPRGGALARRDVFEAAGVAGLLRAGEAERLAACDAFVSAYVAACTFVGAPKGAKSPAEQDALCDLLGFSEWSNLAAVVAGARADAVNVRQRMEAGPQGLFRRYRSDAAPVAFGQEAGDASRLEAIGFENGASISAQVDAWRLVAGSGAETPTRFSELAPGLLTEIGQTQRPERATALFDKALSVAEPREALIGAVHDEGRGRRAVVDGFGTFGTACAPLAQSASGVTRLLRQDGRTASSGADWVSRLGAAPRSDVAALKLWRDDALAEIAVGAASGDVDFALAADALSALQEETVRAVFETVADRVRDSLAVYVLETPTFGMPGRSTPVGFIAPQADDTVEAAAQDVARALAQVADGPMGAAPDVSRRPGGPSAPLAATPDGLRRFVEAEATAQDQFYFARARLVAGGGKAASAAKRALRATLANPKRADILLRDLDRARNQRRRRDAASSLWDVVDAAGGLSDADMVVSALIYRSAASAPGLQEQSAESAVDALARAGQAPAETARTLTAARRLWRSIAAVQAFAQWKDPQTEPVRPRFAKLLTRAGGVQAFEQLAPLMRGCAADVSQLYAAIVLGRPGGTF
ncbi:MAG: hypothetical protein AAGC56_10685, partial [Pseudomonadota bacterium]